MHDIADEASVLAMQFFREGTSVVVKADQSPVTEADPAVEDLVRRRITERFPDDALIGEEFGYRARARARGLWIRSTAHRSLRSPIRTGVSIWPCGSTMRSSWRSLPLQRSACGGGPNEDGERSRPTGRPEGVSRHGSRSHRPGTLRGVASHVSRNQRVLACRQDVAAHL